MISEKNRVILNNMTKSLNEAISRDDIDGVNFVISQISSLMEGVEKENDLYESSLANNFGYLSVIFEECSPRLLKKNKKVLKEGINLIKNDANLLSQAKFYEALEKYNGSDSNTFINEALKVYAEGVDITSVKKSNRKFGDFIRKNELIEDINIDDKKMKMFEDCNFLLTNKSTLSNIAEKADCIKNVASYLNENVKDINEGKKNVYNMVEDYSNKLSSTLNESDQELVKQIIDFKTPIAEDRKKNLHNRLKNEILEGIGKMLSKEGITESEKVELEGIKEEISKKEYCKETIVTDIAKLLEVRDVILDN